MLTITELVEQAHAMAKEKGWYDPGTEKTALEAHMLMVSEIAEATEEARKGTPPVYAFDSWKQVLTASGAGVTTEQIILEMKLKPEGELIELADVMIRIGDYCGAKGWDLETAIKLKMQYNSTRPHRHGNKLK